MRKRWMPVVLAALMAAPGLRAAERSFVQVDGTRLLQRDFAFSRTLARLKAGQEVRVLQTRGDYDLVLAGSRRGWIPLMALKGHRPQIGYSSQAGGQASTEEVAAATKGFNSDVEAEYKARNPSLDYSQLDRLEALTRFADPLDELRGFRRSGRLGEFSAAAQ